MPRKYMAKGYQGVRKGGQLDADLRAMSDAEKRKRAEAKVPAQMKKVFTPTEDAMTEKMLGAKGDKAKISEWQLKAADLRAKAKEVRREGNEGAALTYERAANEYLARIRRLKAGGE